MTELTWGEFKKQVELSGVENDTVVSWIDIRGTYAPVVKRYENGSICVADGFSLDPDDREEVSEPENVSFEDYNTKPPTAE